MASTTQESQSEQINVVPRKSRGPILGKEVCYSKDIQEISRKENDDDLKRMLRVTARIGAANEDMVPRTSVLNLLKDEHARRQTCRTIPLIAAYSVIFIILLIAHYKTSDLSQVEREFRTMIQGTSFEGYGGPVSSNKLVVSGHKTLHDIDTIDDIYTFMQDAVLGLMIRDTATERAQDYNRVLSYNKVVGSVKLLQTRKQRRPCSTVYPDVGPFDELGDNPFLKQFDCFPPDSVDDKCFGPPGEPREGFCPDKMRVKSRRLLDAVLSTNTSRQLEDSEVLTQKQRLPARRLSASVRSARSRVKGKKGSPVFGSESGDSFSVWFLPNQGIDVALQKLVNLKRYKFLDEQTSFVGVNLFGLNPDLGVFFNCLVSLFVVPSGEIIPLVTVVTWSAEMTNPFVLVLDVIFLILWFHLFLSCIFAFFKAFRTNTIVSHVMKPWSIIDWLAVVGGMIVIVMFGMYNVELSTIKESAGQVALATPPANSTLDEYRNYTSKLADFDTAMSRFLPFLSICRYCIGLYTLLCLLRLFKAFEAQPKLAVVSQTLISCKIDFVHFVIVFSTVILALCASVMPILGHRLVTFASISEALIEGLQMVLGNFDYDELSEEYPISTFVWFLLFIILLALIIFNMVLAIIMDTYGVAKQQAAFSDTIWEQIYVMLIEFLYRGSRVPRSKIIEVLSNSSDDVVGRHILLEKIPSMTTAQADSIIHRVGLYEENEDEQALSLSDALRLIVNIRGQMETVQKVILEIRRVQKVGSLLQNKNQTNEQRTKQPTIWKMKPEAEARVSSLEGHVKTVESFLNESMSYVHWRGKEIRDHLITIEDVVRGRQDAATSPEGHTEPKVLGITQRHEDTNDLSQRPADSAGRMLFTA
eukprot:TRINITY_DN7994_c0_g2_i2.p1 TRINITY_DN7994_c0_g2~~TRINITY_DN7994_c0_g2_i2.p1  ORF type:complete len:931 (+),score=108.40 TRINITY_DN7994_c0_g2_i2:185-2794(+)